MTQRECRKQFRPSPRNISDNMPANQEKQNTGSSLMGSMLPIRLEDLIHARSVEDNRREFKATWDPNIKPAVVRTVCAFANDLQNLNGGYIVLGIETDQNGNPVLPPRGLEDINIDKLQVELRGQCRRISPEYQPQLFPVVYQGKPILVIWVPGGDMRPYEAPKSSRGSDRGYFVRQGAETVEVKGGPLRSQLFEQAAKIPFDDRRSLTETTDRISEGLVREFLSDVGSELGRSSRFTRADIYQSMRLVAPLNSHDVPKNVALMFFADDPDAIFPGSRVEVAQFSDDAGGNLIEERIIRGPLPYQIRQTLNHLNSLGNVLVEKVPGHAEVDRTVIYPFEAIREAVVNAVYHRSYESVEPTKIYLYPNRMEIISYPGPVQGIELHHLNSNDVVPPVPARNRRIGEFLKELKLAEARSTGLPKIRRRMSENGSPAPSFDFDGNRTYFRTTLLVHPRYRIIHSLRESALMWATGNGRDALKHLQETAQKHPGSGAVMGQIIEYAAAMDELDLATATFERFQAMEDRTEISQPYLRYAAALLNRGQNREARKILNVIPASVNGYRDLVEAAILSKRLQNYKAAHRLFERVYPHMQDDAKVVQEFAQTKIHLARATHGDIATKRRLNRQAVELLRRAIQLTDDPVRSAWCWFDLAGTLSWLREPNADVEQAYLEALSLNPKERIFRKRYDAWKRQVKP